MGGQKHFAQNFYYAPISGQLKWSYWETLRLGLERFGIGLFQESELHLAQEVKPYSRLKLPSWQTSSTFADGQRI